jgi:hypothetical protein
MIKVFISSPYTSGQMNENLNKHLKAANELLNLGYAPFVPLLFHFLEIIQTRDYYVWLNIDKEWLKQCDVLLRLPGISLGADAEVDFAKSLNIPVVFSIEELEKKFKIDE